MPGEIKHEWNGTVLTITSDSGTSSSDLRGAKGDDGIRGPQGLPGECLHRHELTLTEEQKATGRKNINAYRAINETGNLIEFEANAGLALSAVSAIEPTQEGSGEASPDNVRAISGFDKVELTIVGKNLFNYNARIIGCELSQSMGTTYLNSEWYTSDYIPVKPGSNLVLSGLSSNTALYYDKDKKYISYTETKKFVVPENAYYIRVNSLINGYTTPQVEHGETATAYEPYKGTTATVNLPSKSYGTYDWNTGKLTITHHKIIFDGITAGAKMDSTDNAGATYAYILQWNLPKPLKWNTKAYANKLKSVGTSTVISLSMGALAGTTATDSVATIVNKYNTLLKQWYDAGEPLEVVYELETPETYYLTPYDFQTIEGLNTIWSNTGETTITNLKGNAEALRNIMERVAALEDNIGG